MNRVRSLIQTLFASALFTALFSDPATGAHSPQLSSVSTPHSSPVVMRKYQGSGSRTVIGFISGRNGEYEVFFRGNQSGVFFQNSARTVYARVDKQGDGFITRDGNFLRTFQEVLSYVQRRYNNGDLE